MPDTPIRFATACEGVTPIKIILAERCQGAFHSIEQLFQGVAAAFPSWIHVQREKAPSRFANIRGLLRNLQWIRSFRDFDVVHVTGDIHYCVLGVWLRPTVLTVHDLRFFEEAHGAKRFLFWLFWIVLPVRRASRVTVISEHTKQRLVKFASVSPDHVRVIPNCVSPEFVPSYRSPHDEHRLLQVGTTTNKNIDRLAAACEGMHLRLVVLGSLDDAQRHVLEERKIAFEEHSGLKRAEVVALYQSCSAVVCVSTYEGFGMPIIEGQAVGIPVVASNISPMREVAGAGAILVDPFDVGSMRAGISEAMFNSDRRQKLVAEGFQNVRQYCADVVAAEYAAVYRELVPTV